MDYVNRLVTRAKLEIMKDSAAKFFLTFLMHYPPVWNDQVRTACIGGRVMYINPVWFKTLEPLQASGLLLHEVLHVAFKHGLRGKGKDWTIWGQAADYWVNSWITYHTQLRLPEGGLLSPAYTWQMSVDDIYIDLQTRQLNQPQSWGEQDCEEDTGLSESEIKAKELQIDNLLLQAAIIAEQNKQGIPGGLERVIHELRNPSLPWETMVEKWAKDRSYFGYNWNKPNRRHPEFFIPARGNRGAMKRMVFAIDVSGSVTDTQFDFIVSQVEHARQTLGIQECIILLFDDVVQATHIFQAGVPIQSVKLIGFGGTDLNPMLEAAIEWEPDVLVVFTDMWVDLPTVEYRGDSLWLVLDNPERDGPFGETIHIDLQSTLC